jgi:hypothetical protein
MVTITQLKRWQMSKISTSNRGAEKWYLLEKYDGDQPQLFYVHNNAAGQPNRFEVTGRSTRSILFTYVLPMGVQPQTNATNAQLQAVIDGFNAASGEYHKPDPYEGQGVVVLSTPFEEDADGTTVTVTENTHDFFRGLDVIFWRVTPSNKTFDTLAAAMASARYDVAYHKMDAVDSNTVVYDGVTILIQKTFETMAASKVFESDNDGNTRQATKNSEYFLSGGLVENIQLTFYQTGDDVHGFGVLNGYEGNDLAIIKSYIDSLRGVQNEHDSDFDEANRPEPVDVVDILEAPAGALEGAERADGNGFEYKNVAFTGWEDAFAMADTPFTAASAVDAYGISGDVITMYKDPGVFGFGSEYSSVFLIIKDGYRVMFDVNADDLGNWGFGSDVDVDVTVVLEGGDMFRLDMTSRAEATIFSIIIDGEERSPFTPKAEGLKGLVDESATLTLKTIHKLIVATLENTGDNERDFEDNVDDTAEKANSFGSLGMVALGAAVLLIFMGLLSRVGKKAVNVKEAASDE